MLLPMHHYALLDALWLEDGKVLMLGIVEMISAMIRQVSVFDFPSKKEGKGVYSERFFRLETSLRPERSKACLRLPAWPRTTVFRP